MRGKQILIFFGIVLVVVVGGSFLYANYKYRMPEAKGCTMEARLCPDGSYVGREGPSCDFAECPSVSTVTATTTIQSPATTTSTTTGTASKSPSSTSKVKTTRPFTGNVLAGSLDASPLLEFNVLDYHTAINSNKLVVLFFYTSWDQFSESEFQSMKSAFQTLRPGAVGFRLHYNDSITSADEKLLARDLKVGATRTKLIIRGDTTLLKTGEAWNTNDFSTEISARISK